MGNKGCLINIELSMATGDKKGFIAVGLILGKICGHAGFSIGRGGDLVGKLKL